jgi:SOS-response transcriptional repressor LexA
MAVAVRVAQTSMYSNRPIMKRLYQETAGILLRSMNVLYPTLPHHSSRFSRETVGYSTQQMSNK